MPKNMQRNFIIVAIFIGVTIVVLVPVIITTAQRNCASGNISESCTLPEHPTNGRWSIVGTTIQKKPGEKVPFNTSISVGCDGKYTLDGLSLITCKKGKWTPEMGRCLELCPPIVTTPSTVVTCTFNGETVKDCKKAENKTVATFSCAPFYENPELNRNPFRICRDGSWGKEVPTCTPICGVKPEKPTKEKKTYYPWHVVLFKYFNDNLFYRCTGTLINERIVLTRASCVTDDTASQIPSNMYKIVAGKSSDIYNDTLDTQAQYSDVEEIFIIEDYKGPGRKYTDDIAVMVAKTPFNMSERIQPACFDWKNKYSKEFKYPGTTGFIPGPLKELNHPKLEEVFEINVPFVNDSRCYEMLENPERGVSFDAIYTYEKICAGYINSDLSPRCQVNPGAGLVSKNEYDNKYYLTAILAASSAVFFHDTCDNQRWVLFTKVSKFVDFIVEKNDLYTPIRRSYFQISCGTKSVQATTLIVGGNNVTKGDYPWQVALYKINESKKRLICGGSLINQRVILTAAHCVTDTEGNVLPKNLYIVAVGKFFRDFDDARDTKMQYSTLKDIFTPTEYEGELQNYVGDIAILVTENSFALTRNVEPVCIDWEGKYEKQFLQPSALGFVTGWGTTEENSSPSEVLKELEVPYVEKTECKEKLLSDFEIYLTVDKMCSGHFNKSSSVCGGDSGGGLVFKNKNDDKYYIAGIVSISPQAPEGGCDSQQLALYTKVSRYVSSFILEKVRLYWA